MAREATGLQLQNSPHSGNNERTCRCAVKTRRWGRTKRSETHTANIIRCLLECLRSRRPGDDRKRGSASPTKAEGHHGRLEQKATHREARRATSDDVDRPSRAIGGAPRRRPQKENTKGATRPLGSGASGEGRDNKTRSTRVFLAFGKSLDRSIHPGVHNLPTKQKPHARNKNPALQNHRARERTPFHTDSNGSDHWTPQVAGVRRHTNNSRSRMLERSHIPPMQHHNHRTPDRTIIL